MVVAGAAIMVGGLSGEACTGLIATRGATVDGSVIVTYAADSHTLYGELYHTPAADHAEGAMRQIVDWDSNKPLGQIPQPRHTYATVGNMNENAVTVTESTWGGRPELEGSGLIDYGSLIYIALERSKTAREALEVMTELVDKHGYASEGESFTIADPTEAWIMEMIGKGKDNPGAVWVARRIPDGMIAGHANHARIHRFPLDDPETLYSPDVISFARDKGYYEGPDSLFDFSRAYAVTDFGALRGCDARVWSYFNRFTPDADKYLEWIDRGEGEPMPLWVKPDRKLSATDLKWMMRDHFEGTPYDMTTDIGAAPFGVPYRFRPMTFMVDSVEYTHERAIATQQTGFSLVAQMNQSLPKELRGLLWFGTDDANTCVYLPIFCSVGATPVQLAHGSMYKIDRDANFWVNNIVANQAYGRYSKMIPDIRAVQGWLEADIQAEVDSLTANPPADIAAATQALADRWAAKATADYRELGDYLLVKYLDGNVKKTNEDGTFRSTPYGIPESPTFGGYDDPRYFENIARTTGSRLKVHAVGE